MPAIGAGGGGAAQNLVNPIDVSSECYTWHIPHQDADALDFMRSDVMLWFARRIGIAREDVHYV
ncbi:hypothetical protein E3A20_04780, partial [Planctomyces bekefii]